MIDLKAIALALGATVQEKTVTEISFPSKETIFLEDLAKMDERAAAQRLLNLASGTTTRNAGGTYDFNRIH